jgi:Holliday junction resolvase RusA-like endonuclease
MIHTVEFWLPFPPSTNRLWRSVRGRVILAPEYKDWQKRATEALLIEQKMGKSPVLGSHQLNVYLSDRFVKRCDADNRLKAVLDICAKCHFVIDDKFCRKASVEWSVIPNHDCLVSLSGEVAYPDQWEFARAAAIELASRGRERRRVAARR